MLAGVVHQDDLLQEGPGRPVDDGVDRPQERRPGLVVEHDHDGGGGQHFGVGLALAARKESVRIVNCIQVSVPVK